MRILFTGASSFTGCWFVRELANAGHEVSMTFRGGEGSYTGVRAQRVELARRCGRPLFGCAFGDDLFLNAAATGGPWDLLCHHGADVTEYKSPDFDISAALASNTRQARRVLGLLREGGCRGLLVTGSVFEAGEGAGSEGLPAFSAYGLSKGFTWQAFEHWARGTGLRLGKFVIPNPFGPHEEPRFTHYLVKSWHEGRTPAVNTPDYVRDNIHVSLLARAYRQFAERLVELPEGSGALRAAPSGYIESQGAFAQRFASQMRPRLGLPCPVELKAQTDFAEPRIRINTDPADGRGWDEGAAWDDVAAYYRGLFRG